MSTGHAAPDRRDVVPFRAGAVMGKVYSTSGRLRVSLERGQERLDLDWNDFLDVLGHAGNAFTTWAMRHPAELEGLKLRDSIGAAWPLRPRRPGRRA